MYLNKTQLIGNLTKDPELKALDNGQKVVSVSIATNRTWKDAQGQKQEAVEFHNVVAFGKQAEVIAQYCKKGHQIYIEGRLQTRTWEKDGVKNYRTEVVVEDFQFGNNKKEDKPEVKPYEKPEDNGRTSPSEDFPEGLDPSQIPF